MNNVERYVGGDILFDGHYRLLRPLSTDGGTADVWLAVDVNTIDTVLDDSQGDEDSGMEVAIKIYRPKNALDIEGEQRFRDEFKIVYECRHANLLQPTGFSIFEDMPYLVLPYCKAGSSEQLIGTELDESTVWKFIADVSAGLNRLHTNHPQIIHQDIKPANVLVDNSGNYAITDFGISSRQGGNHSYYYEDENSGTLAYMAPERFQEDAVPIPASDIWAFGATLCEILTGKVPFGEQGGQAQREDDSRKPDLTGIPASLQRLVLACLEREPGNRPTAQQLMDAARARRFPVRSKLKVSMAAAAFVVALAGGAALLFKSGPHPAPSGPLPAHEVYEIALQKMDAGSPDEMREGLRMMDSLSHQQYIPAIYQMGFTYGWYKDSVSVRRKQMLGIEMDQDGMPLADRYSTMAVACFMRIMELEDEDYPGINANATYRLACYYVEPNRIYKTNYSRGKGFLLRSKEWAEKAGDQALLDKIEKGLASFQDIDN